MSKEPYTKTPNSFFKLLPTLSYAELKVLLVVIRQTCGFHRSRSWISNKHFVESTGLSRKAVSTALNRLVVKSHISITNSQNHVIKSSEKRKSCPQLFYSYTENREYLLPKLGKLLLKHEYLLRSIKESNKEKKERRRLEKIWG